jgi:beta-glucosidase
MRFGFYWIDYETQHRVAKDSALWYRDVVAHHGVDRDVVLPS